MIYCFVCPDHGPFEVRTSVIGPSHGTCDCSHLAERNFEAEFSTQSVRNDDPFRKAWLSDETRVNLQAQGRAMDPTAPRDKFEKKHIEKHTGRIYVGDDISGMSKKAQHAIVKGEREKFSSPNR